MAMAINRIEVDFRNGVLEVERQGSRARLPLDSPEAFAALSDAWLLLGWRAKYVYTFAWMGRPVIQLPEDLIRVQEAIYRIKPDVIIETGIAHGGSLIYYASLCRAMGNGRVIGVDIEIRPHNRRAIEEHELSDLITLIEADSVDEHTIDEVRSGIAPEENCFVLLDSNHTKEHVLSELRAYSGFVSMGSYIVAADGIMSELVGQPRTEDDWGTNNPREAVKQFLRERDDFQLETPSLIFDEGLISGTPTYWVDGWLKRVR